MIRFGGRGSGGDTLDGLDVAAAFAGGAGTAPPVRVTPHGVGAVITPDGGFLNGDGERPCHQQPFRLLLNRHRAVHAAPNVVTITATKNTRLNWIGNQ